MARTSAGRRMRLTVPPHHAVNRHLGNLDEESDLNAEVLRLAEIGATLEELCGPMRSVADIVKLLNFRGAPSLFAPAAVAPIHSSPAGTSSPDGRIDSWSSDPFRFDTGDCSLLERCADGRGENSASPKTHMSLTLRWQNTCGSLNKGARTWVALL